MFNQFFIDFSDTRSSALKQYCKMEHVLPESLVNTRKPRKSMKLHLESAAFHLLRRIDRRMDVMISRLTADLEDCGMVQRPCS